jgi:hypothetical protein
VLAGRRRWQDDRAGIRPGLVGQQVLQASSPFRPAGIEGKQEYQAAYSAGQQVSQSFRAGTLAGLAGQQVLHCSRAGRPAGLLGQKVLQASRVGRISGPAA